MITIEANFDGLPGPTHSFGGLAQGNLASTGSAGMRSWPRQAALQSIKKMRMMLGLGLAQGILPPHPRPAIDFLRRLGFHGDDQGIIRHAGEQSPALLSIAWSSSYMWVANAATVSAAADTDDNRIHFTPANLSAQLHRSLECEHTSRLLRAIFPEQAGFAHHAALPCALGDEGAANHTRLARSYGARGISLFVYGRRLLDPETVQPALPARQVFEASRAVARQHGLDPTRVVFARQNPDAINAGVFHNDVIAVGNRNLLLAHEDAFEDQAGVVARIEAGLMGDFELITVPAERVSLKRAVDTYLFNSQLVSPPQTVDSHILIAPAECREDAVVRRYLESLTAAGKLAEVHFLDVGQSMRNGGGPACLRLRVPLSERQLTRLSENVIASPRLLDQLEYCIESLYPEHIDPTDLAEPELVHIARTALARVYEIMAIPMPGETVHGDDITSF